MSLLPQKFSFTRVGLPIIALVALAIAVFVIATGQPDRASVAPEKEPPKANGALADAGRVAGTGVVEPSSELIQIGTALSGLVTDLRVQPGDYVEKGQPLFVVDTRAIRAQAQQTRAAIGEARAAIGEARAAIGEARTAEATAERQLELFRNVDDPAAVSRAEVIRAEGEASAARERRRLAEARLSAAQARLQSAQAQANTAQTEIGRATVRAPIAGEILAVNIRPGEFLSTMGGGGAPFIEMGQTRPMHVRIDIDEEQASRLAMGETAIVSPRGAAGRRVEASFVRAEPQVVPKRQLTNAAAERVDVRVLQVIYALPEDARDIFRVGQQVDAFIPAQEAASE